MECFKNRIAFDSAADVRAPAMCVIEGIEGRLVR